MCHDPYTTMLFTVDGNCETAELLSEPNRSTPESAFCPQTRSHRELHMFFLTTTVPRLVGSVIADSATPARRFTALSCSKLAASAEFWQDWATRTGQRIARTRDRSSRNRWTSAAHSTGARLLLLTRPPLEKGGVFQSQKGGGVSKIKKGVFLRVQNFFLRIQIWCASEFKRREGARSLHFPLAASPQFSLGS